MGVKLKMKTLLKLNLLIIIYKIYKIKKERII